MYTNNTKTKLNNITDEKDFQRPLLNWACKYIGTDQREMKSMEN